MPLDLTRKAIITTKKGRETLEIREALSRYSFITKLDCADLFSGFTLNYPPDVTIKLANK